jgi:hypothetical protein
VQKGQKGPQKKGTLATPQKKQTPTLQKRKKRKEKKRKEKKRSGNGKKQLKCRPSNGS